MNTNEMIQALTALAQEKPKYDYKQLDEMESECRAKMCDIQRYGDKDAVARASGKSDVMYFQKETDAAYHKLLENLGVILPMSETDGQVGKSFYLSTCPEKSEFIKITVSRTNGVTAGRHTETKTVEEAKECYAIEQKMKQIDRMRRNLYAVQKLARTLAATLSALENE